MATLKSFVLELFCIITQNISLNTKYTLNTEPGTDNKEQVKSLSE